MGFSFFLGVLRKFSHVPRSCKVCLVLSLALTGSPSSGVPITGANLALLTAPTSLECTIYIKDQQGQVAKSSPLHKTCSLVSGRECNVLMADLQGLHKVPTSKFLNLNSPWFQQSLLICTRHQALSWLGVCCRGTEVILLLGWGGHLGTAISNHPSKAQPRGK